MSYTWNTLRCSTRFYLWSEFDCGDAPPADPPGGAQVGLRWGGGDEPTVSQPHIRFGVFVAVAVSSLDCRNRITQWMMHCENFAVWQHCHTALPTASFYDKYTLTRCVLYRSIRVASFHANAYRRLYLGNLINRKFWELSFYFDYVVFTSEPDLVRLCKWNYKNIFLSDNINELFLIHMYSSEESHFWAATNIQKI